MEWGGMVHEVCEIMEELSTMPDSMAVHGTLMQRKIQETMMKGL
jgi:hypothetical protein